MNPRSTKEGIKTLLQVTNQNENNHCNMIQEIDVNHDFTTLLSIGSNFIGTQSQLINFVVCGDIMISFENCFPHFQSNNLKL